MTIVLDHISQCLDFEEPVTGSNSSLLATCKNFISKKNLSCGITWEKIGVLYNSSLDQYMVIRGLYTIPISSNIPKNTRTSCESVGFHFPTVECGVALLTLCTARQIDWSRQHSIKKSQKKNNRMAYHFQG